MLGGSSTDSARGQNLCQSIALWNLELSATKHAAHNRQNLLARGLGWSGSSKITQKASTLLRSMLAGCDHARNVVLALTTKEKLMSKLSGTVCRQRGSPFAMLRDQEHGGDGVVLGSHRGRLCEWRLLSLGGLV